MMKKISSQFLGQVQIRMGQGYDVQAAKKLLRKYCVSMEYYEGLAAHDPDYAKTAQHYREMCEMAQASLTRMINDGLKSQGVQRESSYVPPAATTRPSEPTAMLPSVPTKGAQPYQITESRGQERSQNQYNLAPANMRLDVATGQGPCPVGQSPAYPGGPCRGAVAPGAGNLMNVASMAPAASMMPAGGSPWGIPSSASSFGSLGRIRIENL